MNIVIPATKARSDFFNLLNRVLYSGDTIFISKSGTDSMAKIESVPDTKTILSRLAGSISVKDADIMEKSIYSARARHTRKIIPFK